MKKKILCIVAALAVALGLGAASAGSEQEQNPADSSVPPPPFVREDGSIDMSKVPDEIPVFDEHGEIAGYVDSADAFALPTLTPEEAAQADEAQADGEHSITTDPEDGSVVEVEEVTPVRPDVDRPATPTDG